MQEERVIWEAEFNRKVRVYWLLSGTLILALTIVGIPLVPIWLAAGLFVTERYLRRMGCTLTDKSLHVRKGYFIRVEKSIPLDKITDVGLVQGPIMRYLDLETLSVETAGQSAQGALVKLIGIQNTRDFRDAVLRQRDEVVAAFAEGGAPAPEGGPVPVLPSSEILVDIRDAVQRIEKHLADREMTDG